MADIKLVTISMTVRLWNGIDGGLDNKATNSMWDYWNSGGEIGGESHPDVGPTSKFATAIREEGWRQLPESFRLNRDRMVDPQLTSEQWEFILADARDSLPIYESLAQEAEMPSRQEMIDSAKLCQETITIVARALSIQRGPMSGDIYGDDSPPASLT